MENRGFTDYSEGVPPHSPRVAVLSYLGNDSVIASTPTGAVASIEQSRW